jgi:F0F1-type ATP synthase assembly protein I
MPVVRGEAFAILSLLAMMLVAFAILRPVSDEARDWKALGAIAEA